MHQSRMFSIQLKYVLFKALRDEAQFAVFDHFNRRLGQRLHFHVPLRLRTDHRLDRCSGSGSRCRRRASSGSMDLSRPSSFRSVTMALRASARRHAGILAAIEHFGLVDGGAAGGEQLVRGGLRSAAPVMRPS